MYEQNVVTSINAQTQSLQLQDMEKRTNQNDGETKNSTMKDVQESFKKLSEKMHESCTSHMKQQQTMSNVTYNKMEQNLSTSGELVTHNSPLKEMKIKREKEEEQTGERGSHKINIEKKMGTDKEGGDVEGGDVEGGANTERENAEVKKHVLPHLQTGWQKTVKDTTDAINNTLKQNKLTSSNRTKRKLFGTDEEISLIDKMKKPKHDDNSASDEEDMKNLKKIKHDNRSDKGYRSDENDTEEIKDAGEAGNEEIDEQFNNKESK